MDKSNSFRLVLCGVGICLLNMALAWILIISSNKFVMTGLVTDRSSSATSMAIKLAPDANADKLVFLDRLIESDVDHRTVANKQTVVIVALAASFSLIAIGFALFVMGVEAAYTISGSNPTGRLVIQASSPGLVCFILATLTICFAITQRSDVRFSDYPSPNQTDEIPQDIAPLPTPIQLGPTYSELLNEPGAKK